MLSLSNLAGKKIVLVTGFIIVTILIAWALYSLFFKPALTPAPTTKVNLNEPGILPNANFNINQPPLYNINGLLPAANVNLPPSVIPPSEIAQGGVTKVNQLLDKNLVGFTQSDNEVRYYDRSTNYFYRLTGTNQPQTFSSKQFYNVSGVTWSPDKSKAVLEYPDGSKIVSDFSSGKQYTLQKHWQEFSFSPQNNQIIFKSLALDPENNSLVVANLDGTQAKVIETLGSNASNIQVNWSPNNQIVATYTQGKDFDRQELFFVGLNKENFRSTVIEGRGFQGVWSPDGSQMLYSVYSSRTGYTPELWISEAAPQTIGLNRRQLKIGTWATKCTFAEAVTIYCAVPTTLPLASGLYPALTKNIPDTIQKIDLRTGSQTKVADLEGSYSIQKLEISDDGKYLYFTDQNQPGLFTLRLK